MSTLLTAEEKAVLDILADAWNKFFYLPELHPTDKHEFMHGIHACQNIILARPAEREQKEAAA